MKIKILFGIIAIIFSNCRMLNNKKDQCSTSFKIKNITADSTETNILNVLLEFNDVKDNFINYPYIAYMLNHKNDTVATGVSNFYGMLANTTQTFKLKSKLSAFPYKGIYTIGFKHDTLFCNLKYHMTSKH